MNVCPVRREDLVPVVRVPVPVLRMELLFVPIQEEHATVWLTILDPCVKYIVRSVSRTDPVSGYSVNHSFIHKRMDGWMDDENVFFIYFYNNLVSRGV